MERIGVKGAIERMRELGRGRTEERKRETMMQVRMGDMEGKGVVMNGKTKLRGRRGRFKEDLTWKERRMQWRLQAIAQREERRGRGRKGKKGEYGNRK